MLAPLSETFGRRRLYLGCFAVFAAVQVPVAVSGSVGGMVVWRGVGGFFGSEFFFSILVSGEGGRGGRIVIMGGERPWWGLGNVGCERWRDVC